MLIDKAVEVQKDLLLCFIDYERAFDRVRHKQLTEMLEQLEMKGKDIRLITNLYRDQKVPIKVENDLSD